jgi:uncharacterized membrane protein
MFDVFVAMHVICAVVGFGSVALSGVYGAAARRPEHQSPSEETARYFQSRGWSELLILAVPVFGAAALGVRPEGSDFGDFWVVAGLVIWAVAAGLLLVIVRSAEGRIRRSGDREQARHPGAQLMWAAAACDVLFVLALAIMVTQPP